MEKCSRNNYALGEVAAHRLAHKILEDYDWAGNDIAKIIVCDMVELVRWTKGVGFVGWTGVGKTHLLISLYKERMWRTIFEESQLPVWMAFNDIISMWADDKDKSGVLEIIGRADILFIDDLFSTGYGDVENMIVKEIVMKCYDSNKVLCFTSNVLVEQRTDVDARVKDRLKEMCNVIEIEGESRR